MTRPKNGTALSGSNRKNTVIYKAVKKHANILAGGWVLAIDPSCGSASSDPGWAIYEKGELQDSGIIEITKSKDLVYRLQELRRGVSGLQETYDPDVCIVEHIPPRRFGRGGSATGHSSLLQAMGVCLASTDARVLMRVRPRDWQALAAAVWSRSKKSDKADAEGIGYALISLAKEIMDGK